jgi:hypothetical protein
MEQNNYEEVCITYSSKGEELILFFTGFLNPTIFFPSKSLNTEYILDTLVELNKLDPAFEEIRDLQS